VVKKMKYKYGGKDDSLKWLSENKKFRFEMMSEMYHKKEKRTRK